MLPLIWTFQSLPTTFGCPGGCNRAIFKAANSDALKSSSRHPKKLTASPPSSLPCHPPCNEGLFFGGNKKVTGIQRNKTFGSWWFHGEFRNRLQRVPINLRKFSCQTWNVVRAAKWANWQLDITIARISLKLWAQRFQQKWFLSSYSWFFEFFSNAYPIS